VILIDTSAWIEFLRGTESPVCREVERLLVEDLAVTDPVAMEVLAGARDDRHLRDLRGRLGRAEMLPCEAVDYLAAAMLYRQCRQQGETVRRLLHCLIAAAAIRHDVPVLHCDADFAALARHSELQVHPSAGKTRVRVRPEHGHPVRRARGRLDVHISRTAARPGRPAPAGGR
jgi:predicted nucleic acid-binding protein